MLIDKIIAKIDEGGPRSYYSFETFILNLLKYHIESQNKQFLPASSNRDLGDAIAPEGFDEFVGKTIFEIKFSPKISPRILIERIFYKGSPDRCDKDISNLIIVFAKPLDSKLKRKFQYELKNLNVSFDVVIWGPEKINSIVSKHRKQANNIVNKLFSLRLESAVKKPQRNWKEEQEEILGLLKKQYRKGQFSLFLGAGVSSSAGAPDWNTLLNSLFVEYLAKEFDDNSVISDTDINELVERLNNIDEPSALMAARYLRKGLTKNKEEVKVFREAITKILYKLRDAKKPIASQLIKSIASMCMPRRTGAKVKSVITYNFDDLIERQLASQGIMHHSIFNENDSYDPDELPIYHVHGFLPENTTAFDLLEKSTLVFSEEGYHQIYSEAYHWSNLVQLNSLHENNCLMVGLSMTDPNLRRLLDISARNIEQAKHFTFLKRLTTDYFCNDFDKKKNSKVKVISNISAAEEFLERHHKLNEELMKELGVIIIWYEDHDQIPKILNEIIKS